MVAYQCRGFCANLRNPSKLPLSIKKAAQRLAKEDAVSLNQWMAVAEKVGVVETAAEFFKKRAGKAAGAGLVKFLRNAPDVPPSPKMLFGDRRPKWRTTSAVRMERSIRRTTASSSLRAKRNERDF